MSAIEAGLLWIAKAEEVEHIIWRDDKVGCIFVFVSMREEIA